ncbi:MAG: NAD(P)H-hydrate dehydratase [Chloroflexi bacterium]|nr:NAD(P)H-hydrate dehydratase [Chloroflexota bacterium]
MAKLVTTAQMRALERAAVAAGVPERELMRRAGVALAQDAWIAANMNPANLCLVLVGPGNNGGDGLVAARHLRALGAMVEVYLLRARPDGDPEWAAVRDAGIPARIAEDDPTRAQLDAALAGARVVVDAIFGIGFRPQERPIEGAAAEVLARVALTRHRPVAPRIVAADVPSGLDADTGVADPRTVGADVTVTFQCAKVGLATGAGRALAGRVEVIDIGIPATAIAALPIEELRAHDLRALMPQRPADSNKGTFGRAVVAGGSRRYPGAIRLAAEAAARSGCGLVTIAAPEAIQPLLVTLPDPTHEPLPSTDPTAGTLDGHSARALLRSLRGSNARALLVGPGLDLTDATREFVQHLLEGLDAVEGVHGIVLDADALNVLASEADWAARFHLPRVLTPHPGEMARLAGRAVGEVQSDRLTCALDYAARTDSVVVLKGACTVVAAPDGRARISDVADSALAHAGTGDVLAGLIAGLLAQGLTPFDAASAAVWTHSECARAVGDATGAPGMLASDLLRTIPQLRKLIEPEANTEDFMSSRDDDIPPFWPVALIH